MTGAADLPSDVKRLLALAWERRPRQFGLVLLLTFLGGIAEFVAVAAILPFLTLLADPAAANAPNHSQAFSVIVATRLEVAPLLAAALTFALATLITGLVRLALAWSTQSFVFGLGADIAVDIQRRLLDQPYAFHVARNTSDLLALLDKVNLLVVVLLQLIYAAGAAAMAIFLIGALFWVDPLTALVCGVVVAGVYLFVSRIIRRRLAANSAATNAALGQRIKIIQESLGGIRDVIIDGSQRIYIDMFEEVERRFARARAGNAFAAAAPRHIVETVGMILIAGVAVLLLGRQDGLPEALPILGAFALGSQRLLPLVHQFYNGFAMARGNQGVSHDVLTLLELPIGGSQSAPVEPMPFGRAITFSKVGFTYPGRTNAALEELDLVIPHGMTVGLIGETGSGKSTLLDLLMGLIEPERGQISIDGMPLDVRTRQRWWRSVAHVPQSIFLPDTTIAQNIALGLRAEDLDMGQVAEAARRAQLHDFILSLPEAYDTVVGERGIRLSGGQRQRVGIARALYKGAPILILDEATNALDEATEAAVLAAIRNPDGQRMTTILVTHRLASLAACDLIARIEGGRIAETGSFRRMVAERAIRSHSPDMRD